MKKNLMKVIIASLMLTISVGLTGCSKKSTANDLEKIKKAGKIVVGTSADYPPYEFHAKIDGKDTAVGFDLEIAKEIAKDLGVTMELKEVDFDGLLPSLNAKTVDIVISGMTPNEKRKKSVDFSKLYYKATHGVITKKGNEGEIKSLDDLNGKVVGVQTSSVQAEMAKTQIKSPKEIREVGKITDLVLMLKGGKVDAIIMEQPVAQSYVKTNSDLATTSVEVVDEEGGSAVAVRKGNPELVAEINKTIDRLISSDKVSEFFNQANEIAESQAE